MTEIPLSLKSNNVTSHSDLIQLIHQNNGCWRMQTVVWSFESWRVTGDRCSAAAKLSIQTNTAPFVVYVGAVHNDMLCSHWDGKRTLARIIVELAQLPNNNNHILRFHGDCSTNNFLLHVEDFTDAQLRNISCSNGPFEWVNCVFSPQQAVAAFVSPPGKRNVRFLTGGISDGGESIMSYLRQEQNPTSLGKLVMSSNVLRGNAYSFLQGMCVSSQQDDDSDFFWDELEWEQPYAPPSVFRLLSKVNVYCLSFNNCLSLHDFLAAMDGEMRARAIRWRVHSSRENTTFWDMMQALVEPECKLLELYINVDSSKMQFWSKDKINGVLDMLKEQHEKSSCLQVLSMKGLIPRDFIVDDWIRFLQLIEGHPSLRRVELQACDASAAAAPLVRALIEMMKRTHTRSHPLEIVFLGNLFDVRFWQMQVVIGKYDGIRKIASSAARTLSLVHVLSKCARHLNRKVKRGKTTKTSIPWIPDGVYFLLLSNQDLWIPSTKVTEFVTTSRE